MTQTLRDRLCRDTDTLHTAAARAMAATGCLRAADPAAFLAVQAAAFAGGPTCAGAPADVADPEAALATRLHAALVAALRRDLGGGHPVWAQFRQPTGRTAVPAVPVLPTAYAYVMLGATAGIGLVSTRWPAGKASGSAFLDLVTDLRSDWCLLVARLALRPGTGAQADRTVAAARALFDAVVLACAARPATDRVLVPHA